MAKKGARRLNPVKSQCGYCGAVYTPGTPAMSLHMKSQHPGQPSQWKRVKWNPARSQRSEPASGLLLLGGLGLAGWLHFRQMGARS